LLARHAHEPTPPLDGIPEQTSMRPVIGQMAISSGFLTIEELTELRKSEVGQNNFCFNFMD